MNEMTAPAEPWEWTEGLFAPRGSCSLADRGRRLRRRRGLGLVALATNGIAEPGLQAALVEWITLPYILAGVIGWRGARTAASDR